MIDANMITVEKCGADLLAGTSSGLFAVYYKTRPQREPSGLGSVLCSVIRYYGRSRSEQLGMAYWWSGSRDRSEPDMIQLADGATLRPADR